jgi:sec-independent protein translocase protein TatB
MNFGLGYSEIAVILVIGPKKLPELLRAAGKVMAQLRKMTDDVRRELLFSDEMKDVRDMVDPLINPLTAPPVPPKLRVKNQDQPAETIDPASSEAPPAPEPVPLPEPPEKDAADG